MSRRLLLLGLTVFVSMMSVTPSAAGGGSVTRTDADDVPLGDADILETTKRNYTAARGARIVSFRVGFEEPTGDAYSLLRVRIDARSGPRADFVVQVDVLEKTQDETCLFFELPFVDDEPRPCRLASKDPANATSWRVPLRRRILAPTKRIRWMIETDSDFGTLDRAPDSGWYTSRGLPPRW